MLVSGVPGSGKSSLGKSLTQYFIQNGEKAVCFAQDVKNSLEFNSKSFISGLLSVKSANQDASIIVGVLPGYHHLKKVCFELNKEPEFKESFTMHYVITKVNSKFFYINKHRNIK